MAKKAFAGFLNFLKELVFGNTLPYVLMGSFSIATIIASIMNREYVVFAFRNAFFM